jgi:probable selenium-dependent hydroxylase accessory protein YqeC
MQFKQAFDLARGDVVAFIGAGGKTSLMVSLGYELAEAGWRVLATTTTMLSTDQLDLFPCTMPARANPRSISQALTERQFVLLRGQIRSGRVYGPPLEWTRQLLDSVDSDILLVEADDAAGRPFKAPRADEPRVPLETSLVISVASLRALGLPLDSEHIYNPAAMIERYGFVENSPVKSPWLAQVLRDEELGLRGVPAGARVIIFLNQTPERGFMRARARMVARLSLQSERINAVALGSVRGVEPVYELQRPVGALVLATGDSPCKDGDGMLKPCEQGRPAVAHITEQVLRSRIDHIRVVTGLRSAEVRAAIKHLGLKAVHDRAHQSGGALTALKAGLRALPEQVSALLIVPGDQARLQPRVIYHILAAYARGEGEFIVPRYGMRCGYPMLIGCQYWRDLLKMPPQSDFRAIVQRFRDDVTFHDVDTDSIFHDVNSLPLHGMTRPSLRVRNGGG